MADEQPRILGVDPGLQLTGYAVLETGSRTPRICEAGFVRTTDDKDDRDVARRVRILHEGIAEVLDQFRPAVMAVEQLFAHYEHPRTAILMAHARGVIFLAAAQRDIPVLSYEPTKVKKTITGNGRAAKEQVQRTVQRELGLTSPPDPPDVADALAIALCHLYLTRNDIQNQARRA
ncbi:MAG: crossover junction endodeoxyribonuclease RuvC [Gemmataceae bacterium]